MGMMNEAECVITFQPCGVSVTARVNELLSGAAQRAGVKINRHCGGVGTCGKCRVRATGGGSFLGPLTETEKKLLSADDIAEGVRLACCAVIRGSGDVYVIDGVELLNNRILDSISDELIANWSPDAEGYGIAADIGTTTVVCYLLDLDRRVKIDSFSFLNPQVAFGDDVISRIAFSASAAGGGLMRLQTVLVDEMNRALDTLAKRNGIEKTDIREVVAAGNTVMEHIFLGVSPESIGHSPYEPAFLEHAPVPANDIGLEAAPAAVVKLLPNVAGYVGGDIVAGVAALGMDKQSGMKLFIDIGTNNEIVIGNRDVMFCCATAAGPAFEGARIQYGMRASLGAIETVGLEDSGLVCGTIGGTPPKGLCGSGLIDAVALLLCAGVIDQRGRLQSPEECKDERFSRRISRDHKGMLRFLLTDPKNQVYLTQKDIREVQLALGAVKAGTEIMLDSVGIGLGDLDEVLLAGAFGNNIDVRSAMTVGLLPRVRHSMVRSVYNSSGLGACLSLASPEFYESARVTAKRMSYIELSSRKDFEKRFISNMIFS
jgi:uncharacterized 2Fe-2S/4Fe-4S cluster protein (DUF4445 family)